jgi:hypothetical protein
MSSAKRLANSRGLDRPGSESADGLVDYVDAFGRKRRVRPAELAELQRLDNETRRSAYVARLFMHSSPWSSYAHGHRMSTAGELDRDDMAPQALYDPTEGKDHVHFQDVLHNGV